MSWESLDEESLDRASDGKLGMAQDVLYSSATVALLTYILTSEVKHGWVALVAWCVFWASCVVTVVFFFRVRRLREKAIIKREEIRHYWEVSCLKKRIEELEEKLKKGEE